MTWCSDLLLTREGEQASVGSARGLRPEGALGGSPPPAGPLPGAGGRALGWGAGGGGRHLLAPGVCRSRSVTPAVLAAARACGGHERAAWGSSPHLLGEWAFSPGSAMRTGARGQSGLSTCCPSSRRLPDCVLGARVLPQSWGAGALLAGSFVLGPVPPHVPSPQDAFLGRPHRVLGVSRD